MAAASRAAPISSTLNNFLKRKGGGGRVGRTGSVGGRERERESGRAKTQGREEREIMAPARRRTKSQPGGNRKLPEDPRSTVAELACQSAQSQQELSP